MSFHGNTRLETVRGLVLSQKHEFIIIQHQVIERGDGVFTIAKTNNFPTRCGLVNIKFSFFGGDLSCTYFYDIPDKLDIKTCVSEEIRMNGSNSASPKLSIGEKYRTAKFCDPTTNNKEKSWIEKWS